MRMKCNKLLNKLLKLEQSGRSREGRGTPEWLCREGSAQSIDFKTQHHNWQSTSITPADHRRHESM